MIKNRLDKLDLDIYNEKLDNGMDVYIIPKDTVNNIYVTFTTKYGSTNIEFKPNGEDEFYKSPYGIAHFLEHKLFEQKSGEDPFSFYSKNGCDNNAYTNYFNTTYLFSGPSSFEDNLNYLLDFVQEPYFTDENVEKEKGIIVQELQMYKDDPYRHGMEKILENSFIQLPINIPVIGTVDSVNSITKEDLYKCYNTFYHPNNMVLVISGNVNTDVINIIKENQKKKQFNLNNKIVLKKYNEPDKVNIEEEKINMNVSTSKLFMGYKLNISKFNNIPKHIIIQYIGMYLDLKFGPISEFSENLKKDEIINSDISFDLIYIDNYLEILFISDTNRPEELKERLIEYMKQFNIKSTDFERSKKGFLSSYIYMSDNIYKLNDKIINNIILENKILIDIYKDFERLNYVEFENLINEINFENKTSLIINPLDTCQTEEN